MGFFEKLSRGLAKTRAVFLGSARDLEHADHITDETYDDLTEQLVLADVSYPVAEAIVQDLRGQVRREHLKTGQEALSALKTLLSVRLGADSPYMPEGVPAVILLIGVNGAGKTTSAGKLANYYAESGKRVLLAAGDTFRAAANDQLKIWSERAGVQMILHEPGSDPSSVIYDAVSMAKARGIDLVICDTAGRLQTKTNLMDELGKMKRVAANAGGCVSTLLVLDATTGQNAVSQAKQFAAAAAADGIILTKLDGTAKGGSVISIRSSLGIPVRFIGVGEQMNDLMPFDAEAFVKALFNSAEESAGGEKKQEQL